MLDYWGSILGRAGFVSSAEVLEWLLPAQYRVLGYRGSFLGSRATGSEALYFPPNSAEVTRGYSTRLHGVVLS